MEPLTIREKLTGFSIFAAAILVAAFIVYAFYNPSHVSGSGYSPSYTNVNSHYVTN